MQKLSQACKLLLLLLHSSSDGRLIPYMVGLFAGALPAVVAGRLSSLVSV
jgi:hypothetical protein